MTEQSAEQMRGTVGQMSSATGTEGALQLLQSLQRGTAPQSRDCWPWIPAWFVSSAVLGRQTGASDMACVCLVRISLLCAGCCKPES